MMEIVMARIVPLCLALLAACIPTFVRSDAPPPNTVGHAHTCQSYFPKAASETGTQGTTTMSFLVGTDGNTSDIYVAKSSGDNDLDYAATRCVQRWHYLPAKKDGKPVSTAWKANIVWVLVERPLDNPDGPNKPCTDQYPKEATSPGVHGTTKLTVQVAADGSVKNPTVLETSGDKTLDDLAAICVSKWRLSPEPKESTKTASVSWTIPYYGK